MPPRKPAQASRSAPLGVLVQGTHRLGSTSSSSSSPRPANPLLATSATTGTSSRDASTKDTSQTKEVSARVSPSKSRASPRSQTANDDVKSSEDARERKGVVSPSAAPASNAPSKRSALPHETKSEAQDGEDDDERGKQAQRGQEVTISGATASHGARTPSTTRVTHSTGGVKTISSEPQLRSSSRGRSSSPGKQPKSRPMEQQQPAHAHETTARGSAMQEDPTSRFGQGGVSSNRSNDHAADHTHEHDGGADDDEVEPRGAGRAHRDLPTPRGTKKHPALPRFVTHEASKYDTEEDVPLPDLKSFATAPVTEVLASLRLYCETKERIALRQQAFLENEAMLHDRGLRAMYRHDGEEFYEDIVEYEAEAGDPRDFIIDRFGRRVRRDRKKHGRTTSTATGGLTRHVSSDEGDAHGRGRHSDFAGDAFRLGLRDRGESAYDGADTRTDEERLREYHSELEDRMMEEGSRGPSRCGSHESYASPTVITSASETENDMAMRHRDQRDPHGGVSFRDARNGDGRGKSRGRGQSGASPHRHHRQVKRRAKLTIPPSSRQFPSAPLSNPFFDVERQDAFNDRTAQRRFDADLAQQEAARSNRTNRSNRTAGLANGVSTHPTATSRSPMSTARRGQHDHSNATRDDHDNGRSRNRREDEGAALRTTTGGDRVFDDLPVMRSARSSAASGPRTSGAGSGPTSLRPSVHSASGAAGDDGLLTYPVVTGGGGARESGPGTPRGKTSVSGGDPGAKQQRSASGSKESSKELSRAEKSGSASSAVGSDGLVQLTSFGESDSQLPIGRRGSLVVSGTPTHADLSAGGETREHAHDLHDDGAQPQRRSSGENRGSHEEGKDPRPSRLTSDKDRVSCFNVPSLQVHLTSPRHGDDPLAASGESIPSGAGPLAMHDSPRRVGGEGNERRRNDRSASTSPPFRRRSTGLPTAMMRIAVGGFANGRSVGVQADIDSEDDGWGLSPGSDGDGGTTGGTGGGSGGGGGGEVFRSKSKQSSRAGSTSPSSRSMRPSHSWNRSPKEGPMSKGRPSAFSLVGGRRSVSPSHSTTSEPPVIALREMKRLRRKRLPPKNAAVQTAPFAPAMLVPSAATNAFIDQPKNAAGNSSGQVPGLGGPLQGSAAGSGVLGTNLQSLGPVLPGSAAALSMGRAAGLAPSEDPATAHERAFAPRGNASDGKSIFSSAKEDEATGDAAMQELLFGKAGRGGFGSTPWQQLLLYADAADNIHTRHALHSLAMKKQEESVNAAARARVAEIEAVLELKEKEMEQSAVELRTKSGDWEQQITDLERKLKNAEGALQTQRSYWRQERKEHDRLMVAAKEAVEKAEKTAAGDRLERLRLAVAAKERTVESTLRVISVANEAFATATGTEAPPTLTTAATGGGSGAPTFGPGGAVRSAHTLQVKGGSVTSIDNFMHDRDLALRSMSPPAAAGRRSTTFSQGFTGQYLGDGASPRRSTVVVDNDTGTAASTVPTTGPFAPPLRIDIDNDDVDLSKHLPRQNSESESPRVLLSPRGLPVSAVKDGGTRAARMHGRATIVLEGDGVALATEDSAVGVSPRSRQLHAHQQQMQRESSLSPRRVRVNMGDESDPVGGGKSSDRSGSVFCGGGNRWSSRTPSLFARDGAVTNASTGDTAARLTEELGDMLPPASKAGALSAQQRQYEEERELHQQQQQYQQQQYQNRHGSRASQARPSRGDSHFELSDVASPLNRRSVSPRQSASQHLVIASSPSVGIVPSVLSGRGTPRSSSASPSAVLSRAQSSGALRSLHAGAVPTSMNASATTLPPPGVALARHSVAYGPDGHGLGFSASLTGDGGSAGLLGSPAGLLGPSESPFALGAMAAPLESRGGSPSQSTSHPPTSAYIESLRSASPKSCARAPHPPRRTSASPALPMSRGLSRRASFHGLDDTSASASSRPLTDSNDRRSAEPSPTFTQHVDDVPTIQTGPGKSHDLPRSPRVPKPPGKKGKGRRSIRPSSGFLQPTASSSRRATVDDDGSDADSTGGHGTPEEEGTLKAKGDSDRHRHRASSVRKSAECSPAGEPAISGIASGNMFMKSLRSTSTTPSPRRSKKTQSPKSSPRQRWSTAGKPPMAGSTPTSPQRDRPLRPASKSGHRDKSPSTQKTPQEAALAFPSFSATPSRTASFRSAATHGGGGLDRQGSFRFGQPQGGGQGVSSAQGLQRRGSQPNLGPRSRRSSSLTIPIRGTRDIEGEVAAILSEYGEDVTASAVPNSSAGAFASPIAVPTFTAPPQIPREPSVFAAQATAVFHDRASLCGQETTVSTKSRGGDFNASSGFTPPPDAGPAELIGDGSSGGNRPTSPTSPLRPPARRGTVAGSSTPSPGINVTPPTSALMAPSSSSIPKEQNQKNMRTTGTPSDAVLEKEESSLLGGTVSVLEHHRPFQDEDPAVVALITSERTARVKPVLLEAATKLQQMTDEMYRRTGQQAQQERAAAEAASARAHAEYERQFAQLRGAALEREKILTDRWEATLQVAETELQIEKEASAAVTARATEAEVIAESRRETIESLERKLQESERQRLELLRVLSSGLGSLDGHDTGVNGVGIGVGGARGTEAVQSQLKKQLQAQLEGTDLDVLEDAMAIGDDGVAVDDGVGRADVPTNQRTPDEEALLANALKRAGLSGTSPMSTTGTMASTQRPASAQRTAASLPSRPQSATTRSMAEKLTRPTSARTQTSVSSVSRGKGAASHGLRVETLAERLAAGVVAGTGVGGTRLCAFCKERVVHLATELEIAGVRSGALVLTPELPPQVTSRPTIPTLRGPGSSPAQSKPKLK